MLLLRGTHTVGQTVGYWILLVLLYQIILGIIIGALVGVVARKVLKFSKRRELIDRESMVAMYVALSLLVTALTTLAGSDDLLAAFACGTAFAWDDWWAPFSWLRSPSPASSALTYRSTHPSQVHRID